MQMTEGNQKSTDQWRILGRLVCTVAVEVEKRAFSLLSLFPPGIVTVTQKAEDEPTEPVLTSQFRVIQAHGRHEEELIVARQTEFYFKIVLNFLFMLHSMYEFRCLHCWVTEQLVPLP